MLASIRNAVRNPYSIRLVAGFASKKPVPATKDLDGFGALAQVLSDVGTQQPAPRKKKSSFAAPMREKGPRHEKQQLWKPFMPNRPIRPHELTYKSRFIGPRSRTRRAAVGPAPPVARYQDVFHQFGIDPITQAQNPTILNEYISDMGKIYGRNITGLTSKSQRRMGKAIRRAKMMGIIPILSKPTNNLVWNPRRR
ncbi:ribosomal protein S18 [Infundibulicybe gibba]|nr:ribosomal protein S18 [Infundibulicybe gibba]